MGARKEEGPWVAVQKLYLLPHSSALLIDTRTEVPELWGVPPQGGVEECLGVGHSWGLVHAPQRGREGAPSSSSPGPGPGCRPHAQCPGCWPWPPR